MSDRTLLVLLIGGLLGYALLPLIEVAVVLVGELWEWALRRTGWRREPEAPTPSPENYGYTGIVLQAPTKEKGTAC